jgi:hypothetical protein
MLEFTFDLIEERREYFIDCISNLFEKKLEIIIIKILESFQDIDFIIEEMKFKIVIIKIFEFFQDIDSIIEER